MVSTFIAGGAILFCGYWNVATSFVAADHLWERDADEIVIFERRMAPIRLNLLAVGYKGEIGFVTNTDLRGQQPWNGEDDKRWGETQYVMIPWVITHGKRDTPFVIADFWDGPPATSLEGFFPFYDTGDGLVVYRKQQ